LIVVVKLSKLATCVLSWQLLNSATAIREAAMHAWRAAVERRFMVLLLGLDVAKVRAARTATAAVRAS
jgi:hypothetical protein